MIRRDPRHFGVAAARWTLPRLHAVCSWVRVRTPGGLSPLLARLGLHWKCARAHIRSPDPLYEAKRAEIARIRALAAGSGGRLVCLYVDEVTIYRQPSVAQSWEAAGPPQPYAEYSHASNTKTRVIASLDDRDARVVFLRASKIGVSALVRFGSRLRAAYPQAERIYVIWDNWPVHVHPDFLVALEPQESAWQPAGAPNWRTKPRRAMRQERGELRLPIQCIWLPTYASWLNPIEKLWRKLQQEEIHLHRLANELGSLRERIDGFLEQFAGGSPELRRYVGLGLPD